MAKVHGKRPAQQINVYGLSASVAPHVGYLADILPTKKIVKLF